MSARTASELSTVPLRSPASIRGDLPPCQARQLGLSAHPEASSAAARALDSASPHASPHPADRTAGKHAPPRGGARGRRDRKWPTG